MSHEPSLQELRRTVSAGHNRKAVALTRALLEQGMRPSQVLHEGLLKGLEDIGERFRHNEVYVPQVVLAAGAMSACLERLRPLLVGNALRVSGRVLLATCRGDLHDLGKKIVGIMLQGAGFEVIDLGVDVEADTLVEAVHRLQPEVVGLSAGMSVTLSEMKWVVNVLEGSGLRRNCYLLVGGMPVTAGFARRIGADGYAPDAPRTVDEVWRLLHRRLQVHGKEGSLP